MGHTRFPIVEVSKYFIVFLCFTSLYLQTVSCFRSTGSMPVPRPVTLILPNYLPHQNRNKRKIAEETATKTAHLVLQHATIETCQQQDQQTATEGTFEDLAIDTQKASEVIVKSEAENVIKKNLVKIINCEAPPVKKEPEQRCKKHSRCHCDLLSLETTDFFTIKV